MITVKIIGIIGMCYVITGLGIYRPKWIDELYVKVVGVHAPSNKEYIRLGIMLIVIEIIIDVIINSDLIII